jgi:ABC-type multidrug transport system fused ATPase/permease subunit
MEEISKEPKINYPVNGFFSELYICYSFGLNMNQIKTLCFTMIQFILISCVPLTQAKIMNVITDKYETSELDKFVLVIVFLHFGNYITTKIKFNYAPGWSEESLRIKQNFLEKLLAKDIEFFDFEKPANILKSYQDDFWKFRYFEISDLIEMFLKNLLQLVYSFSLLFYFSKSLLMFEILKMVFRYIFDSLQTKSRNKYYDQLNEIDSSTNAMLRESIMNMKLLKIFSTEDKIVNYINSNNIKKAKLNQDLYLDTLSNTSLLVNLLIKAAQIWYSVKLIRNGDLSIGEFTSFEVISTQISSAFSMLTYYISDIREKVSSVRHFINYMQYRPNIKNGSFKKSLEGKVEFKNVSFYYPTKKEVSIFKNFDLHINPGEMVAFVGPSGCGKSSVSQLVHRIYDVIVGEILIDGVNIKEYELESLHSQYGYISQDPMLFTGTIRSNITFAIDNYTEEELEKACKDSYCYEFIMDKKAFPDGYESKVHERGNNLSGGQKQRIAIARALMKKVKILILDEATSALDAKSENEVQKALDRICHENKITTIIIAHRLSTVKNCDRIHVIKNGNIIEQGKHQDLLDLNGEYRKLVDKQLELAN